MSLSDKIISEMKSSEMLLKVLVEVYNIPAEHAREFVKGLSFSEYRKIVEATVDRNPSLTSGVSSKDVDAKIKDVLMKNLGGDTDLDDLETVFSTQPDSANKKQREPAQVNVNKDHDDEEYDPDYIPDYIKNDKGEIDYGKIKVNDRIAWEDNYGKIYNGKIIKINNDGTYDIRDKYKLHTGVEEPRLITPTALRWRYRNNKKSMSSFSKGKDAAMKSKTGSLAKGITNTISNTTNELDRLSKVESVEEELNRIRELAGLPIKETASCGATGAGSIASSPSVIGDIDKRPSTDLQVRARKDRDNSKKRKKRKQGKEVK